MKVQILPVVALAVLLAVAPSCRSSGGAASALSGKGRTILVAVDRSKSMYLNDPSGLGPHSLQAMIAMAAPGTKMGMVAYSERADEVAPITPLLSRKDRLEVARAASGITLEGMTDFRVPFEEGTDMLSRTGAPEGSALILVTDGQHNRGESRPILDVAREFGSKKWEIDALAVTPSRCLSLLDDVTREAGGRAYRIGTAQDSLDASLQLAARADRMFAFLGKASAVTVLPGTENLLLVALKGAPDAGFESVNMRVGGPAGTRFARESESVYAYPSKPVDGVPYDIMNIWDPPAGLYEIVTSGTARRTHILSNLPVEMSFPEDKMKEIYPKDELVAVTVRVTVQNGELYEAIKASGGMMVSVEPRGPGSSCKKALELSEVEQDGDSALVFTGELALLAGGSEPVEFVLTATLSINCAEDGAWLRRERTSIKAEPGGSVLTVTPMEVDFGPHWSDEETVVRECEVGSLYADLVAVSVTEVPTGFSAEPAEFDVSSGLAVKVSLALDPSQVAGFGPAESKLLLVNKVRDTGAGGIAQPVMLRSAVYGVELPEEVKIPAHPGKEFTEVVPLKVTPPLKFRCELGSVSTETGKLDVRVLQNLDGTLSLACPVPLDTPDGIYKGVLRLIPELEGLSERTVSVSVSVSGTPQVFIEPSELSVKADKTGWVEQPVAIWTEHYEDLEFGVDLVDMKSPGGQAFISGQYDSEFLPGENWDGKSLKPAQRYSAKLRFYVSSDLRPGSYSGEASFWVKYREGKKVTVKLPVTIEVSR
jgi:hypothetical protein